MSENSREHLEELAKKVEQNPDSAKAHYNLGLAYTSKGKMDSAAREFSKALELDPTLVEAWVNLGGTHMLKWEFRQCVEANEKAIEQDPGSVLAHFNKGQGHLYLGEKEEMLACYERVVELDPEHAAGHYFLAVALLANERTRDAREHLSKSVSLGHRPRPEFLRELEKAESSAPVSGIGPANVIELDAGRKSNKKEK